MNELLQQDRRRTLHERIRTHPGLSARELQRSLGLGWGETAYHLKLLSAAGLIRRERGGHRDYYFVLDVTWGDRKLLLLLRSPSERRILVAIFEKPGMTFPEIAKRIGLAMSTVSFHLRHMLDLGVVAADLEGGFHRYRLTDPARLAELLRLYQGSFEDTAIDRFVASWSPMFRE